MKNNRKKGIVTALLCGVLLLGGCGSQGTPEEELTAEDILQEESAKESAAQSGVEDEKQDKSMVENAPQDGSADQPVKGTENGSIVIEIGPDKAVWGEGSMTCTLYDFQVFDSPKDASVSEDEMFSAKYKERKEQMLRKYRKSVRRKMDGRRAGQCAAAAALLVLATGTIGVAANSEFFYRVWGTHGKEKIESHEEVLYDEEKGTSTTVTYPQREYTDKNLDRAEDTLYCYDYMVVQQPDAQTAERLTLEIYERETGQEEWGEAESLQVPISSEAQQREYGSAEGGKITIFPLSMKIDMGMAPGLTEEEAGDPWHAFYVSVNYKDGSNYLVHEHEIPGIHSCEVETDNASYALEDMENQLIFVFNRLNDPEQVESITVNETVYTAK